jgi:tRNA nucleotidyltransferase/poly(A) polymerase
MSDYNFLMESRLSPEQFTVIGLISRLAAEQGLNLYLTGGAVRDLTYGQQVVRDLDFIVEGPIQRILRALPVADSRASARGARGTGGEPPLTLEFQKLNEHFGSAELLFSNGVRAELGMCHDEVYSRPGHPPEVRPATVFEDLKRRDFAINAMAISLHPNSRGLLLDPTNGAGDIERHEIRALQSRGFVDDPSRIYRLLRLGMRLDFTPDERTQRWLDAAWEVDAWQGLDPDQQARELASILHEDQPGRVLKMLSDRKVLGGLDKKLASVHLPYDRFARIRSVLQNAPGADPFVLNFHCLVERLGADHKARLAKAIIGESKAIKLALGLEQDAKKVERLLSGAKANLPSQVYAMLSPQPQPVLFYLLANAKSIKVQNRVKSFLFKFPQIHARLPRAELQATGVKAGPEFDHILSQIFALQLDGKINSHPQLMKEMRSLAGIKEPPPPPPPPPPKKGKEAPHEPPAGHPRKKGKEAAAPPVVTHPHGGKGAPAASPAATPSAVAAKAAAKPPAEGKAVRPSKPEAKSQLVKAAKPAAKRGPKPRAPKAAPKPAAKTKRAISVQAVPRAGAKRPTAKPKAKPSAKGKARRAVKPSSKRHKKPKKR